MMNRSWTIALLGSWVLGMLAGCAKQAPTSQPTLPSPTASAIAPSTSVSPSPTPTAPTNQSPLSAEEKAKLAALNMRVAVPTYLPSGLQVAEFKIYKGDATPVADSPAYSVLFTGAGETCLRLYSGKQDFRYTPENETTVKTRSFGVVTVQYGAVPQQPGLNLIQAVIKTPEGHGLDSGYDPNRTCNPISLAEFQKVLQSMEYLDRATTTAPSAPPSNLAPIEDAACQGGFRQVMTADGSPLVVRGNEGKEKTVANDTIVLVNLSAARGDRSEITIPGGFTGWVDDRSLAPAAIGNSRFTGKMMVKTLDADGSVNLRAEPSLTGKVVSRLRSGVVVTVKGAAGQWYFVETSEAIAGYVSNQFLICQR
jgi:hypothetical protein